jgi:hypothetical protein
LFSGEDQNHVVPTWGFDKRTWNTRKFQASIYDLGGGRNIRGIWSHYFAEVILNNFKLNKICPNLKANRFQAFLMI